jgi:ATP-dependent Clp protease ATP-binding subunit ClpA
MPNTQRYSHHARRALTHAALLVQEFRHPRINTGHLLVGVMLTEGSIGHSVLASLELLAPSAKPHLHSLVLPLEDPVDVPPNDAALDIALHLAADESTWLGHHYIGTEHLLLGITRTNVGNASDLFHLLGVAPDHVRHRVRVELDKGRTEFSSALDRRRTRLSELSRRVIYAAEQTAVALDDQAVGISHLLLVMLKERRSITSTLLAEVHLSERRLMETLQLEDADALYDIEQIVRLATDQAHALGNHYTGTEHLLLALTTDPTSIRLLEKLSISSDSLRELAAKKLVDSR